MKSNKVAKMINKTNIEHGVIAVIIQLSLACWMGLEHAGIVAVAAFAAREYAQAEHKARAKTGRTLTDMMPWHLFNREYWSLDALMDVVVPAIAVSAAAYVGGVIWVI